MAKMDQETQQPYQYQVLETAPDYKDNVIEKSGIKSTFTLREIEDNRAALTKTKTELEAQIQLQDATTTNIESFHPFVKDMSMADMHTAGMFYEARGYRDKCQKKLDEINKLLTDEAAEEEQVMTTLGFVKTEVPQEAAPVEAAATEAAPAVEPAAPDAPQTNDQETTDAPGE